LRCAIQSIAALGEVLRSDRLHGVVPEHAGLVRLEFKQSEAVAKFADNLQLEKFLAARPFQSDEELLRHREAQAEGRKVEGGYIVKGACPGVEPRRRPFLRTSSSARRTAGIVMFLRDCANPAITLQPCKPFLAMDGTGTFSVQFRDVFVPDELILAEPAGPFVKKIRAGFILLQAGMGSA